MVNAFPFFGKANPKATRKQMEYIKTIELKNYN